MKKNDKKNERIWDLQRRKRDSGRHNIVGRDGVGRDSRGRDSVGRDVGKYTDYDVYRMDVKERSKVFALVITAGVLCGYLYFRSLFACALFGILSLGVIPMYKKLKSDERKRKLRAEFRDFLYSISSSVNAGRSLEEAMEEAVGPVSLIHGDKCCMVSELERMNLIIRETNSGAEPLLRDLALRSHLDEISEFVDVCATCRKTGGDMNTLILKASDIITQHIELEREKEVVLSEKKLESRILALMPPAVILLINISSSDYLAMMYMTTTGRLIMAASLISTIGSFLWSFKLISFD